MFPVILFLEFKSKEELQLMPQTMEEHIQEMEDSDSDTSSESGAQPDNTDADAIQECEVGLQYTRGPGQAMAQPNRAPYPAYF